MNLEDHIKRTDVLLEAFPYIKRFTNKIVVIKYGGSLMINDDLKPLFAKDIALLKLIGVHPVIIHGGGKEISKWMERLGKESVFIDGLRVTDSETLEITEMVLSGKINSEIVSMIHKVEGKSVGLSGKDGPLFTAKKIRSKRNQDLGFVGDIENVDTSLILTLIEKGYIPVISSIGLSKEHESLNMNADHVAECIASALNASKLIYLTDVDGLVIDNKLRSKLTLKQAETLLSHKDVIGGMLPKLTCASSAIKNGVNRVHILNGSVKHAVLLELFTDAGIGTMIAGE
ncbi:MAG: acetylglutamate kinase [Rickettsiales bacterium]|nr:acetylglutamate kinase [Rickettsiales bacterium]|tara:strand:- start:2307 stop:3167 length:861 start_codon:yes stop_codon:yes gene_type:complete